MTMLTITTNKPTISNPIIAKFSKIPKIPDKTKRTVITVQSIMDCLSDNI